MVESLGPTAAADGAIADSKNRQMMAERVFFVMADTGRHEA